jgi:hypothetical protein
MNKGIFSVIFDLKFNEFVTTRIIKVLFILWILLSGVWALFILGGGLATKDATAIVGALIMAPLVFLLLVVVGRVWLELIIVAFRIAENTARLVQQGMPQGVQGGSNDARSESHASQFEKSPDVPSVHSDMPTHSQRQLSQEEARGVIRKACMTSLGIKDTQMESLFSDLRVPPGDISDLLDDIEARYGFLIPPIDRDGLRCAADIERYILKL